MLTYSLCIVLLSPSFFYSHIWPAHDHQLKSLKSEHTTDGFYGWDERLSSSFMELPNASNRTNWHLKKGTYTKKYRPLYDGSSQDDYVKWETLSEKEKSWTMIIASLLVHIGDARYKNFKYTFICIVLFSLSMQVNALCFI